MSNDNGNRLTWTVDETADRLGLPARTIQAMCSRGELAAVKFAGKWLVPSWRLEERLGAPSVSPAEDVISARAELTDKLKRLRRLAAEFEEVLAEMEV